MKRLGNSPTLFLFTLITLLLAPIILTTLPLSTAQTTYTVTLTSTQYCDTAAYINWVTPIYQGTYEIPANSWLTIYGVAATGYTFDHFHLTGYITGDTTGNKGFGIYELQVTGEFTITSYASLNPQPTPTIAPTATPGPTPTPPPASVNDFIITKNGGNYELQRGDNFNVLETDASLAHVVDYTNALIDDYDTVTFNAGSYTVDASLNFSGHTGINVVGTGEVWLVAAVNLNTPVIYLGTPNHPVDHSQLYNIKVNGNRANQNWDYTTYDTWFWTGANRYLFDQAHDLGYPTGISSAGHDNTINTCTVVDSLVMGVSFFWQTDGAAIGNNGVVNCNITRCGWNGITFYYGTNDYAVNNDIRSCDDIGISTQTNDTIIVNNRISYCNGEFLKGSINCGVGIALEDMTEAQNLHGSMIYNNTLTNNIMGISTRIEDVTINSNTITFTRGNISNYAYGGPHVFNADHDTVKQGLSWGIDCDSDNQTIINNYISGMIRNTTLSFYIQGGYGIFLKNSNNSWVAQNTILNCEDYALFFYSPDGPVSYVSVFENTFSGNSLTHQYATQTAYRGTPDIVMDDAYATDHNFYWENIGYTPPGGDTPSSTSTPLPNDIWAANGWGNYASIIVNLALIFIPAVLGFKFAKAWGFFAGINIGIILLYVVNPVLLWAVVVIIVVDALMLFGKMGFRD